MTEEEAVRFARWWLDRFSDEEIAEPAHGFGVEDTSARSVAIEQERLLGQSSSGQPDPFYAF